MQSKDLRLVTLLERITRLGRNTEQASDLYPAQWAALRYLSQANRFSRSPKAVTTYLGSTKGTVSQTLNTLEKKGLLEKVANIADARSTDVKLTGKGEKQLLNDPIINFEEKLKSASGARVDALTDTLENILSTLIRENNGRMFGQCRSCLHFRKAASASTKTPHHCGLLNAPLSEDDSHHICMEHEGT